MTISSINDILNTIRDFDAGLLPMGYAELYASLFDGKSLSEDEARKRYYGLRDLAEHSEDALTKEELILARDERNEARNYYRKQVRFDRLEDIIVEAAKNFTPLPTFERKATTGKCDKVGILQLSDWHYGLKAATMVNYYDTTEAYKRIASVFDKVSDLMVENKLDTLYCFVQGDLISGSIHNILRLQNQEDLINQIIGVSEKLAVELNRLSEICKINVVFIGGNHERVTPKKEENLENENYIRLVEWFVRERTFHNENIDILRHTDPDSCYIKIFDYNVCILHGDKDIFKKADMNMMNLYGINFDFIFSAHEHHVHYEDIGFTRVISNGSLCGVDTYAKNLRTVSYPTQNFNILYDTGEISVMPLLCNGNHKRVNISYFCK